MKARSFLKPKKIWNGIDWSVDYNAIPVSMILILLAQNLQIEIKDTTTLGIVLKAWSFLNPKRFETESTGLLTICYTCFCSLDCHYPEIHNLKLKTPQQ